MAIAITAAIRMTVNGMARDMADSPQAVEETIRGDVASGYEPVADVFRSFFDRKWDTGAGVSVYRGGAPVVRLTGGTRISASGDALRTTRTRSSSSRRRRSSSSRFASS